MRWIVLAVIATASVAVAADPPTKAEIAKATKPAVAVVHTGYASASATCVSPRGYFVTVAAVLFGADRERTVTVAVNAGEKDEKVYTGRAVRVDPAMGLVLVRVDDPGPFVAVDVGDENKVGELDEVLAFLHPAPVLPQVISGVPPPLKPVKVSYSTVGVNKLKVASVQRTKGVLAGFGLESGPSVASYGGPVMDLTGKLIGVWATDPKTSVATVLPANRLRDFLTRPDITIDAPDLDPAKKSDKTTVRARVFALPELSADESVEFVVSGGGRERRVEAKRAESGWYEAAITPFEKAGGPVPVEVVYADGGSVRGDADDRKFTAGGKEYTLGKVAGVGFGKWAGVTLPDGTAVAGEVKGLDDLPVTVGGKLLALSTATAREVRVVRPALPESGYRVTAVARRAGKEVGREDAVRFITGSEPWGVEGMKYGRLTKPPEADKPTTFAIAAGTPGESHTEGKTFTFDPATIKATATPNKETGTVVGLDLRRTYYNPGFGREDVAPCTLSFSSPYGEPLEAKVYPKAVIENDRFSTRGAAGLFFPLNALCQQIDGRFAVWELETADDKKTVTKLAFDAILHLNKQDSPILVTVRLNSKYK